MSGDGSGKQASVVRRLNWAIAAETAIAAGLAGLGVWYVLSVKEPDPWAGLALIGVAALIYFMRGQVISKFNLSKDGFAAELVQKAEHAVATAEAARKDASLAKEVVTQISPGRAVSEEPRGVSSSEVQQDPARWVHPKLTRGISDPDDPQRGQWGGQDVRNGRKLDADVVAIDEDWFRITLKVFSTDTSKPLNNRVRFHLHHTFRKSVVIVKPRGGVAELERVAYGAFTVGAEVEGEPDTFLELNLADERVGAPRTFRER